MAFRFIPYATCFWLLVIACLLAGTGCVLPDAEKFLRKQPEISVDVNARTGRVKYKSGKDFVLKFEGEYNPVLGAWKVTKGEISTSATDVTKAQGDAAAQILPHYQIALANNQQNLAFVNAMTGSLLDFTATVIPQIMADRQGKRDARQTQQGGPNTQADTLIGLLSAGVPGLDQATAAMLDEAVREYMRVRSGQATPGPVAPVQP